MEYASYLKKLDSTNYTSLKCLYCGSEALSPNPEETICHFCEGYVNRSDRDLLRANDALSQNLSQIQQAIDEDNFDNALKATELLATNTNDPLRFYGVANFYRFFSDYKYHYLNYNQKGFMEPNSNNIYTALDMTSKSKEFFYKTIKITQDIKTDVNESMLFLAFISQIKLKRIFEASKTLEAINKLNAKSLAAEYSNMVYSVESDSKSAETNLAVLLNNADINAFYYLARYLAKKKKLEESKVILGKIIEKVHMPAALYLLHKINEILEETKI